VRFCGQEFVASFVPTLELPGITMDITLEIVEAQAMQLSAEERELLSERLMLSLGADPEIEAAWERIADERQAQVDSGQVQMLDGNVVLAELRERYRG
jgi:hypothetical protein